MSGVWRQLDVFATQCSWQHFTSRMYDTGHEPPHLPPVSNHNVVADTARGVVGNAMGTASLASVGFTPHPSEALTPCSNYRSSVVLPTNHMGTPNSANFVGSARRPLADFSNYNLPTPTSAAVSIASCASALTLGATPTAALKTMSKRYILDAHNQVLSFSHNCDSPGSHRIAGL